ncbi:MAG: propanediol utilization protein [Pseudomonadota bacterium]
MTFVAGHFGEWLQGRLGSDGPVVLITLACPAFGVRAELRREEHPVLCQTPEVLDAASANRLLRAVRRDLTGRVTLRADFPPGSGTGVSTASLIALARALGAEEGDIAPACCAAEGASDPLMQKAPDAVLWASREGRVVRVVQRPPLCDVVGGFFGPPQRTDPGDTHFPDIVDLAECWDQSRDLSEFAALASASAARTTALRGPAQDPTAEIAKRLGALGHARAHTGPARALLFAPGSAPPETAAALRAAGFRSVVRFQTGAA